MLQFLGAPEDLPPSSRPFSQLGEKRRKDKAREGRGGADDRGAFALAARLLVSSSSPSSASLSSPFSSLPRSVGSRGWAAAHALVEELNAKAHADASEGREEEEVPVALSAEGPRQRTPLSAVVAHLLVASSWRAKALPSILESLESKEKEETNSFLALYGLLRHDVSCANLLAVALSAPPPPPPKMTKPANPAKPTATPFDGGRFYVPSLPPAIRALRDDDSSSACELAAWAARSVRWWDAGKGGRAAAARTADAFLAAASAKASCSSVTVSASPSLAADETALAAASSALAVFRCLTQHSEDLPPGVGAALSGEGAGDLVPVLLSLLDRPPWIFRAKSVGKRKKEKTLVFGGRGWESQEEEEEELLFPLPTAHSWLSLLFLCLGASFSSNSSSCFPSSLSSSPSSSSSSSSSSSFCALRSDLRDWSANSSGQFLGARIASLLKKSPVALAAVPPLAGALLPFAEAAAAGRGAKIRERAGGAAAAAAAKACSLRGGSGGASFARSPLLVEVVSRNGEADDIESAIDATDWDFVASRCVERLLGRKEEEDQEEEEEEEKEGRTGCDGKSPAPSAPPSSPWAGLGAVVKALEEQPKLASLVHGRNSGSSSSDNSALFQGAGGEGARSRGRVRVSAWATTTKEGDEKSSSPLSSLSSSPNSSPPWSETFELELDPSGSPEEVDLPCSEGQKSQKRRGIRRKLRLAFSEGQAPGSLPPPRTPPLPLPLRLPPTLPPSGRLVASTLSSFSSATYRIPSCELSLEIDSLPKTLWVTLGSVEGKGEGEEEKGKRENGDDGSEEKRRNNNFVLQLKLRRQPAGRASRKSAGGHWGAYAPCGGAITTLS